MIGKGLGSYLMRAIPVMPDRCITIETEYSVSQWVSLTFQPAIKFTTARDIECPPVFIPSSIDVVYGQEFPAGLFAALTSSSVEGEYFLLNSPFVASIPFLNYLTMCFPVSTLIFTKPDTIRLPVSMIVFPFLFFMVFLILTLILPFRLFISGHSTVDYTINEAKKSQDRKRFRQDL